MFSALRKFASKNEPTPAPVSSNVQAMSSQLQRKFAKGIQYNMKIVIKGDNNVGKTCLFNRLQGKTFSETYQSTPEIQVASIQWSYKATDDVVKVEIWDVVDKAKKKKKMEGLKLDNSSAAVPDEVALDAEFLDVYKGTHGVVMVLDITKAWTFEYVQREVPRIPGHIPVLVLGNHRDMGHHRQVREDDVRFFAENVQRPDGDALVRYAESSMRNGFGLKLLHRFLNVPFLTLQRACLVTQLATNERETEATHQELDLYEESDEANYDVFIDQLANKRRQTADANAPAQKMPHSQTTVALNSAGTRQAGGAGLPRSVSQPGQLSASSAGPGPPSEAATAAAAATAATARSAPSPAGSAASGDRSPGPINGAAVPPPAAAASPERHNVDAFVPDGALDANFLDEVTPQATPSKTAAAAPPGSDSEDDTAAGNPMVAGFQDDIDDLELVSGAPRHDRHALPDSSDEEPAPPPPDQRRGLDVRLVAPPPAPDESIAAAVESEPEEASQKVQTDSGAEAAHKTKKKKKKDKEKEKENGEKKKKKKHKEREADRSAAQRERDALEDFLERDSGPAVDEAYEAI
ncbi:rab-like protein 6 [Pollicipes pollicipes]|uniref:rab-like protein 6 n=1 Tax=Pollicipes pollicipes TaxID=41117 RepID=UPI0018852F16|nr:rab-like protein 6 [Pollicipes pollicipes]